MRISAISPELLPPLDARLMELGLVPIQAVVTPNCGDYGHPLDLELKPDRELRLIGISSHADPNIYWINQICVNDRVILKEIDLSTFCCNHIVPFAFGDNSVVAPCDRPAPITFRISFMCHPSAPPTFSLTLWGCVEGDETKKVDPRLVRVLRELKASSYKVTDPQILAMFDKYAEWI